MGCNQWLLFRECRMAHVTAMSRNIHAYIRHMTDGWSLLKKAHPAISDWQLEQVLKRGQKQCWCKARWCRWVSAGISCSEQTVWSTLARLCKPNHPRGRLVKTTRPVPEELQPPRLKSQKLLVNLLMFEFCRAELWVVWLSDPRKFLLQWSASYPWPYWPHEVYRKCFAA